MELFSAPYATTKSSSNIPWRKYQQGPFPMSAVSKTFRLLEICGAGFRMLDMFSLRFPALTKVIWQIGNCLTVRQDRISDHRLQDPPVVLVSFAHERLFLYQESLGRWGGISRVLCEEVVSGHHGIGHVGVGPGALAGRHLQPHHHSPLHKK